MVEEPNTNNEEQAAEETDPGKLRAPSQGASKFSRTGIDSSIAGWLERKEKGPTKTPSKGLSRGGRLNPVSKKGRKKKQEYAKASKEHYKNDENRRCALCGSQGNLSIHHMGKRLEGNHAKEETFITLCLMGNWMDERYPQSNHSHAGGCHGWIEGNKKAAREMGLLI